MKRRILGVPDGPVVSKEAAAAMAKGVPDLLGCDLAVAVRGVGGPEEQDGHQTTLRALIMLVRVPHDPAALG